MFQGQTVLDVTDILSNYDVSPTSWDYVAILGVPEVAETSRVCDSWVLVFFSAAT